MATTAATRKANRLRRAEQGLCSVESCPVDRVEGKTRCQRHLDLAAASARKCNETSIKKNKCPRCKKRTPEEDRKYCGVCLAKCNEATKANYRKDPTKQKAASNRWRTDKLTKKWCTQCGDKPARPNRDLCADCAVDASVRGRRLHAERRRIVLEHYGTACACCHDATIDLLQIDHRDGGGTKHLKEIGQSRLYKWLIDNNFPDGFQALCGSCNHGWGHLRYCPHAKDRLVQVTIDGKQVMQDPWTGKVAKPDYPEPLALGKKARRKLAKGA